MVVGEGEYMHVISARPYTDDTVLGPRAHGRPVRKVDRTVQ